MLQKLQSGDDFDLLIVGAGATGAGCALDAATRGLKVACVERDDFAAGTSSRSTKLVHGGVRYLEKAFKELDYEQYKLVREALHERGAFLANAPHLAYELPIMLPIRRWYEVPYYWVGSKMYDILAGRMGLTPSYYLSKKKALEAFPTLDADRLCGAIVYHDGAQNDARMNVTLALSAARHGAVVANHTEVVSLVKGPRSAAERDANPLLGPEKIVGAQLRDVLTGKTWTVKCRGVVNATGPFTDGLRQMDEPSAAPIVAPSAGVHMILPNYFAPRNLGLLDPMTSDGRVIFFLPWQGHTIVGTTDSATPVSRDPMPPEEDVNWLLKEMQAYFKSDVSLRRSDVLAVWSGIRPLVRDPHAANTAALVRNHMVHVSPSGLLTIAGGKWTTYRAMAADAIDRAVAEFGLESGPCATADTRLVGADAYSGTLFLRIAQQYGLDTEVAQHLASDYGDRAPAVAALAAETGAQWPVRGRRLVPSYPYLEGEVRYACRNEYACTAVDVLARRMRLAFLNASAALECLPRVIDLMGDELEWSTARKRREWADSVAYLRTMGLTTAAADAAERHPPAFRRCSISSPVFGSGWSWWPFSRHSSASLAESRS